VLPVSIKRSANNISGHTIHTLLSFSLYNHTFNIYTIDLLLHTLLVEEEKQKFAAAATFLMGLELIIIRNNCVALTT